MGSSGNPIENVSRLGLYFAEIAEIILESTPPLKNVPKETSDTSLFSTDLCKRSKTFLLAVL